MKTIIIDNYDSFTYNLSHLVKELGAEVNVVRNDRFALEDLEMYDNIILSPGPGIPEEAGLLLDVIRTYASKKPILGVCLGEQAIGQVFGGKLTNLSEVFHGVQTNVIIKHEKRKMKEETSAFNEDSELKNEELSLKEKLRKNFRIEPDYIFEGLPETFPVGRYHSWVVDSAGFPECLAVTALSSEGQIMALKHRTYDIHGIQFHPESVLTPEGKTIVGNWLFH